MKNKIKNFVKMVMYDKIGRFNREIIRNKVEQSKLENTNFSIISQNCIGSIMYHDLNEKFCSPTINMLFEANDFIKFLTNIKMYLCEEIIFKEQNEMYPVGMLKDIEIKFVHYKTKEEALEKWNIRKKRINWDNLFIIACDDNMTEETIKMFQELKFKNKILFTNNKNHIIKDSIYICNIFDKADARLLNFCDITGKRYYQKYFDYVKWLNEGGK